MLRRHLRLLRRACGYAAVGALLLVALSVAVVHQLLPYAAKDPARVAAWLSERAGRTVRFDALRTDWTRRGPLLRLDGLRIGDGERAFSVGDAEMLVSMYRGVLPGQPLTELRVRGLSLTLERAGDGTWRVRGLPGQEAQAGSDPFAALEGLGELQLIGARLAVVAPALGIDARVPRIDLRLRVDGARVRAGARVWSPAGGAPVDAAADIDRVRGNGTVYGGTRRADVSQWQQLLAGAGVRATAGTGHAQAWARLSAHRIVQVISDVDLRGLHLAGAPLYSRRPQARFDRVQALLRWQRNGASWRVDAPRLRTEGAGEAQTLDGLMLAGGERLAFRAAHVDAGPLVQLAVLSDRLSPGLRDWLQQARPRAQLRGVALAAAPGGAWRMQGAVEGFGFAPVGQSPGFENVYARVQGDGRALQLDFDPARQARFNWPAGFGVPHPVSLRGRVLAFREGPGWRVATPSLHIAGAGYALATRGAVTWQGDGSRPWIDLAASVERGSLPVAKGFWVRHLMSGPLVSWLDHALVAGQLVGGRAIASGDLDHWPFRDRNGRFEASARIVGGVVKFQPGWPPAEDLDAGIRFLADGFELSGSTRVGDVRLPHVRAGIDHYGGGDLTVDAATRTEAASLLALLRRSPLEKQLGDTLGNLVARGPAAVTFALDLPLHDAPMRLGGTLALEGAHLAEQRWKLAFDDVRGSARYTQDGFAAEGLAVRHEGLPGRLSLRAGAPHVRDPRNSFEAAMDASVRADTLLARAPDELAWLKPYLDGRSSWSVGLAIPKVPAGRTAPTLLQLRSNLVGTALTLPAPLAKPAPAALATSVETPLPLGSGEVVVNLGSLAAVRARTVGGRTGVRVVLGAARVDDAPPAAGLVATGRAGTLDAIDWIALAKGGGDSGGGGLPLQRIDVSAARLALLGGSFPNARVVVAPAAGGVTAVRVEGPSLQGTLRLPPGEAAAVSGRFERVYWRAAPAAGSTRTANAAAASATATNPAVAPSAPRPGTAADTAGFNPGAVPALAFDIDELRLNDARLGTARFRSRPVPGGMRIEQLQTRAGTHRLDMSGDWTGRGAAARTRLDAGFASDDFGALLTGLGLGGRLDGGKGSLALQAGWRGAPSDFNLAGLEGRLALDVRNGRLLELEPGAGRVLGLLSLAELPRRLTLDFRDFFAKGFAFNRMSGTLRIDDGLARSDDLRIDGPAATIDIRGATNLRAQRFDQVIDVHPKSGNLLTAVGALAGGPVGAAIGAAANAVLKKPLGNIGAKTYRVTGPWTEPKVEVVGKGGAGGERR